MIDWLNGSNLSQERPPLSSGETGLLLAPLSVYAETKSSVPHLPSEPTVQQPESDIEPETPPAPSLEPEPEPESETELQQEEEDNKEETVVSGEETDLSNIFSSEQELDSAPHPPHIEANPPEEVRVDEAASPLGPTPEINRGKPRLALGTNDKPVPILWTHVVSMPDEWPEGEAEPPETRGGFFTQKLHDNLQGRKNLAVERLTNRGKEPRCRLRAAVLCFFLLLALAVPSAALLWMQKQSQTRPDSVAENPAPIVDSSPMPVAETTPNTRQETVTPQLPVLNYEQRIERGTEALRQGRYDAAAFSFAGALETEEGEATADPRPWLGLAWAYHGKGMKFDVVRILDRAKELFPHNPTIETMRQTLR